MTSHSDDSTPLHKAIQDNDLEGFESLLCNPNTDINAQNQLGQTALFVSLENRTSNSFTMRLIQAGCDVNISDNDKTTPLHQAMLLSSNEIAHELIKRGADINAQRHLSSGGIVWEETIPPLHAAIEFNNLEGVAMLLYYGADVICSSNMTPVKIAAFRNFQDIVKILINYCDESYYTNENVNGVFRIRQHTLSEGTALFGLSSLNANVELAKLMWNKINFESILDEHNANCLLAIYIKDSDFVSSGWLKYLYLIFQIFVTRHFKIMYKCVLRFPYTDSFFEHLFNALHKRNIEPTARLRIINLSLSLGAPMRINDLKAAHMLYGFGEELEALIYGGSYTIDGTESSSLISNVLGVEDFSDVSHLFRDFLEYNRFFRMVYSKMSTTLDCILALLGSFSIPYAGKREINSVYCRLPLDWQLRIFEKVNQIPECPTLVELSRNQARKYIRQTNRIKHPYQFHDAIKKLNIPQRLKDLIRFKTPLY